MESVRTPAVAGLFYAADPAALDAEVAGLLGAVSQKEAGSAPAPKAIIAPHAGYLYSGPIAARAYARLEPLRDRVTRVVLLGPAHREYVRGLATSEAAAFATPLGEVPVDRMARARALELPQVNIDETAHRLEHSLEVHLPFLQRVLGAFSIVPFVVGQATAEEVAEVLELLWGGSETLIVVSTDLSHYHDYETARRLDAATAEAIEALDPAPISYEHACGRNPVIGLLAAARQHGLHVTRLDLRNSGDIAGTRGEVVGYGAWMLT